MTEKIQSNPERYQRLAEPRPKEEAARAAENFVNLVGELRERFGIPELIMHFEVYVQTDEGVQTLTGGCGWGNQLKQAQLARKAADRELAHLGRQIEAAAAVLPDLWRTLITNPSADEESEKEDDHTS